MVIYCDHLSNVVHKVGIKKEIWRWKKRERSRVEIRKQSKLLGSECRQHIFPCTSCDKTDSL